MFYINTNAETIANLHDIVGNQRELLDEAISDAAAAACDVIEGYGHDCEYVSRFADWNGGKCSRMNGTSAVAVSFSCSADMHIELALKANDAFEAALNAALPVAENAAGFL